MARVFVSSTFNDLQAYREKVRTSLRRLGHDDVAMEYYVAEPDRPIDRCLADVRSCDLYIGIFALRYGHVPTGRDKSITELEAEEALIHQKDCLIFLLSDSAAWPTDQIEFAAYPKIQALRSKLKDRCTCSFFANDNELQSAVVEAVSNWERKTGIHHAIDCTDWAGYKDAIVAEHEWVRLAVIAGAKQDRIAKIPLTDVFIPQVVRLGRPTYEVPDEVLRQKHALFEPPVLEDAQRAPGRSRPVATADADESISVVESVSDVVGRERTQVLLGGPGSGKSTLLHYSLMLLCAEFPLEARLPQAFRNRPLPFLIELRQYILRGAPDFIDYIIQNVKDRYHTAISRQSLLNLLNTPGAAVVLFDGLDEIFEPSQRAQAITRFRAFSREFEKVTIVITSRIVGYDATELGVHGFRHYTILDFNLKHIREFIPKWYRYYTWQGDTRDGVGLTARILESPRLMELAGNPLLLTMMAIIYKHQELPEERWKLYERCTEVLLEHWDIKRKSLEQSAILPLDVHVHAPQKADILSRVAVYMLQHGQRGRELNAIGYQPLMSIVAEYFCGTFGKHAGEAQSIAEEILNHLRERTYVLAEIGDHIFGFVHRTFMEYFAACHCRAEFNARKSDYEWIKREVFGANWSTDHWQEVLLLLIAMLSDQGSPVEEIIKYLKGRNTTGMRRLTFAARCVAELTTARDRRLADRIAEALVRKVAYLAQRYKRSDATAAKITAALSALARIGSTTSEETRAAVGCLVDPLKASIIKRHHGIAWQVEFALRSRSERLQFALSALKHREEVLRISAITVLEHEAPAGVGLMEKLLRVGTRDRVSRVRQAALGSLSRICPGSEEVLSALESSAREQVAFTHVEWLIRFVARQWTNSDRGLDLVLVLSGKMPRARDGYDYASVGRTAANCIAESWPRDDKLWAVLESAVLKWDDPLVQQSAGYAIGAAFPTGGAALERLRTHAVSTNPETRERAIKAIAAAWPNLECVVDFLCERAVLDQAPEVRSSAVRQISGVFQRRRSYARPVPPLPDAVVSTLEKVVTKDTDLIVRASGLTAFAKLGAWSEVLRLGPASPDHVLRCVAVVLLSERSSAAEALKRIEPKLDLSDYCREMYFRRSVPNVRKRLEQWAQLDQHPTVRRLALVALRLDAQEMSVEPAS